MKILALSNLFPPHNAGVFDVHCQTVTDSLRLRGHTVKVLTSSHGLRTEQRDPEIERRFQINGAFGDPKVTSYMDLKAIELHNNGVLQETLEEFQPEAVLVFSLMGVSKSLLFTLFHSRLRVVYDVYDHWLSADVADDPWLRFWNAPSLPFMESSTRKALELSGERGRLDVSAPTRMKSGYDRLPTLFGDTKTRAAVQPNTIAGFRFDRLFFCSHALKHLTEQVGFCVSHGSVLYPGINNACVGQVQPASKPMRKFLVVARLTPECGAMTALKALKIVRDAKLNATLSIYGRGDSSYLAQLRSFVVASLLPVEFLTVSNSATDMPAIYKQHDVLLHTPEWAEPFPFTPLEAMGCGLPVIGARSGGAEELLRHGENALTYSSGDAADLAARIQELQISPALRVQMADTAQAEVLSKFNESTVMDNIENFLTYTDTDTA